MRGPLVHLGGSAAGAAGASGSGSDKRGGGPAPVEGGRARGGGEVCSASARDMPSRGTNSPERIAVALQRARERGGRIHVYLAHTDTLPPSTRLGQ